MAQYNNSIRLENEIDDDHSNSSFASVNLSGSEDHLASTSPKKNEKQKQKPEQKLHAKPKKVKQKKQLSRIEQSEHRIYIWSYTLVMLSATTIFIGSIFLVANLIIYSRIENYTSYEMGAIPEIFSFQPKNTTIKVDIDDSEIKSLFKLFFVLDFSIIFQALICFFTLKPLLVAMIAKRENDRIKAETDIETNASPRDQVDEEKNHFGPTHDQTRSLQRRLLAITVVNSVILLVILVKAFSEYNRVVGAWIEDNIESQNFSDAKEIDNWNDDQIDNFKTTQRSNIWFVANILCGLYNIIVLVIFTTLNGLCIYSSHQLSRSQKRTEEH